MLAPFLIMIRAAVDVPELSPYESTSGFRVYCLNRRLQVGTFAHYEVSRALENYSTVNVLLVPDFMASSQDILEALCLNYMGKEWPTHLRVPDAQKTDTVNMQVLASKLTMKYWCETNFK